MTKQTTSNIDPTQGGGPWTLIPADKLGGSIDPGDVVSYQLRTYEFRNRKGYFRDWLPLDAVQITNKSPDSEAKVTVSGTNEIYVPPNSVRGYSDTGIIALRVENVGSTTIDGGDLRLELSAERYDADQAAYEDKQEHPAVSVAKGLIGL